MGSARYEMGSAKYGMGSSRYVMGSPRYGVGSARCGTGSARYGAGSARYGLVIQKFVAQNSAVLILISKPNFLEVYKKIFVKKLRLARCTRNFCNNN